MDNAIAARLRSARARVCSPPTRQAVRGARAHEPGGDA
jgi:hypothetical protein